MTRKQIEGLSTLAPQTVAVTFTMTRKQIEGLSTMARQTERNAGSVMAMTPAQLAGVGLGTGYQVTNAQRSPTAAAVLASMSPETRVKHRGGHEPHVRAARGRRGRPSVERRTSRRGADASPLRLTWKCGTVAPERARSHNGRPSKGRDKE